MDLVNRAEKHLAAVAAWEDKKKAALFAQLKKLEVILKLLFSHLLNIHGALGTTLREAHSFLLSTIEKI